MSSHTHAAARENAIRQGAMNRYFEADSTGSSIVEHHSTSFIVHRIWDLVNVIPGQPLPYSATTGEYVGFDMCITGVTPMRFTAIPSGLVVAHLPVIATTPAAVLDLVRTVFGLNVRETADVFRVTRQTVYQWMKLSNMEQVRSHTDRERIKTLFKAARLWMGQPEIKGRWLRALLPSGISVLDLIKAPVIDFDALMAAYTILASSTAERRKSEGERAAHAVTALANALSGLGGGRKARKESR